MRVLKIRLGSLFELVGETKMKYVVSRLVSIKKVGDVKYYLSFNIFSGSPWLTTNIEYAERYQLETTAKLVADTMKHNAIVESVEK